MTPPRKGQEDDLGIRPLTARSVLLSTLLGLDPPVQTAARLVATAELFGIGENAARVALSRMASAGEVVAEGGRYRLTGRLLDRQQRQESGRRPVRARRWTGGWHVVIITAERRSASDRSDLRAALAGGRMAEWREGTWARPDNLARPELTRRLARHCEWLSATPNDPTALVGALWDLAAWDRRARALVERLDATRPALDAFDTDALASGFMLSAAVLRHLAADPLLPDRLLPPEWPGTQLRATYDGWDGAYRDVLAGWHRRQVRST